MITKVLRGILNSSSLIFLRIITNGKMISVVNNNLYSAIIRGGALQESINIDANETDTMAVNKAIYGLFIIYKS
jgi:hypothetical protein